jgi:hypothetical protein
MENASMALPPPSFLRCCANRPTGAQKLASEAYAQFFASSSVFFYQVQKTGFESIGLDTGFNVKARAVAVNGG